uniref:Uncharacterized protein n=1 Tax=Aegilops tauschii subsp. strangulata TaxID=200361 RepID=A0A453R059_AEGTS
MQVIIGFAAADVPVGGAAATFGGASATAPKGNLHQTLPHNSASKLYLLLDPSVEVTHVMVIRSSSSGSGSGGATLLLLL